MWGLNSLFTVSFDGFYSTTKHTNLYEVAFEMIGEGKNQKNGLHVRTAGSGCPLYTFTNLK